MKTLNNLKKLSLILISIASLTTVSFADLWEMIQGDKLDKKDHLTIYIVNRTPEPRMFGTIEVLPFDPNGDINYSYRTIVDKSTFKEWVNLIDSQKQKSEGIEIIYDNSLSFRALEIVYQHQLDIPVQIAAVFDLKIKCDEPQHYSEDGGSLWLNIYPEGQAHYEESPAKS